MKEIQTKITKEMLNERLQDVEMQKQNLQKDQSKIEADMNACDGAIQDCRYWLNILTPVKGGK
ncbi:hypothetical protein LCGC14_2917990 [marine sediment metagenome]|uniref:Uncharacterized protein n=1 Tax=marine sediment metagenome TaxID=412755 RepID=A0A0F8ZX74_9ZZZZ